MNTNDIRKIEDKVRTAQNQINACQFTLKELTLLVKRIEREGKSTKEGNKDDSIGDLPEKYSLFRNEEDESSGEGKFGSKQTTGQIDPEANKLSRLQLTTNPGTDPHGASKESQE